MVGGDHGGHVDAGSSHGVTRPRVRTGRRVRPSSVGSTVNVQTLSSDAPTRSGRRRIRTVTNATLARHPSARPGHHGFVTPPPPGEHRVPSTDRALGGTDDALRLRQFLSDSYALAGGEFNWEPRRWEGMFWTVAPEQLADPTWGAGVHVWSTEDGSFVAAAVPDGPGGLALQVDPRHRWLEDDVLDWAERHLARTEEDGARVLHTWAFDWDADRRDRLVRRGYTPVPGWSWHNRRRRTSHAVEPRPLAAGYVLRNVEDSLDDAARWVGATNAVFGHCTPVDSYCSFLRSPSYDPQLHLVAEAPDGSVAAFAGFTIDSANKVATLEPVGTRDGHRRLGLAQTVISEGLRRVADRGVEVVHVANWGTADAGHLYASLGFEHDATQTAWRKAVTRANP
jgi:mycothiol synthase